MLSFSPIRPLLSTGTRRSARWFSYAGLGIGVLLLLCSVQMYINIQQLLGADAPSRNGSDFISVRKEITNETMGNLEKNLFSAADISDFKKQPFVEDVTPLLANNFRLQLSGGNMIPFVSDFFVEALDEQFIDTVPPNFTWQEGQEDIPIIIASDFLEIYNVFAPGYGLPQISEESATSLGLLVICYTPDGQKQVFRGRLVALSDRINSILVPASFLNWANKNFGGPGGEIRASRLYVKTKDANNPAFLNYLAAHRFEVNKDKTKFGRVKVILQGIFTGLGVFGLMVVALALMLFSFYLQLMIARSKDNLQLLLTLGYSPEWLSRNVSRQFVPVYIGVVLAALLLTSLLQWGFYKMILLNNDDLSRFIHPFVALAAGVLILLSIFTNFRMVKKLLYKLY